MNEYVAISRAPLDAVPEIPTVHVCQICLEAPASVFQICGPECPAKVCNQCIVQYLIITIYSFYPGVLPKVRCPVCLNLLNKTQWKKRRDADDNSHVLKKYKTLCRQSCGFYSPCCDNVNYSMLPRHSDDDCMKIKLPIDQVEAVDELYRRGVEFCFHRQDVDEFYHFLTSTFPENVEELMWVFLPKITDEERRATLLLRHLNKNPDTWTRCCKQKVCFKCKATDHHNGDCEDFIEDENVVECRGCGVTVVKVEGCDSLYCVCGYEMEWTEEVERQRAQRKLLAPTDNVEYDIWLDWHEEMSETREEVKRVYLDRLVHEHRALLRRFLLPRVYRLRRSKTLSEKKPESQ
eukprot:jgi/Phyca11/96285/e_gw1.1.446.1